MDNNIEHGSPCATSYTIEVPCRVTGEFLDDIIITAVEDGGISYWADVCGGVKRDETHESFREGEVTAEIWDLQADTGIPKLYNLDRITIIKGIRALLAADKIHFSIKDYVGRAVSTSDSCDIDIECADCIIQFALFGEIVYG